MRWSHWPVLAVFATCACGLSQPPSVADPWTRVDGPYLGQPMPGDEPRLLAPGLISTGLYERDVAVSADGRELLFGVCGSGVCTIMTTRALDSGWSAPVAAPFAADLRYRSLEPWLSPDGRRVYFLSDRPPSAPEPGARVGRWEHQNIWVAERRDTGWSEARPLAPPVNGDHNAFYPSLTGDGVLYFTRSPKGTHDVSVWRAEPTPSGWAEPAPVDAEFNREMHPYNAAVAPDEGYLVFCADPGVPGDAADLWVAFRDPEDGSWSEAVNLGGVLNPPGAVAQSVSVSPDGTLLFYSQTLPGPAESTGTGVLSLAELQRWSDQPENGQSDVYWVSTEVVERLRTR